MHAARTIHLRMPRLLAVVLGSLLTVAAVLGATVMLGVALAVTVVGGLLRAWRRPAPPSETARDPRTIAAEYSVIGRAQRGGSVPDSGGFDTKASNELS